MKELYCVILQNFLTKETVKVLADDISVSEDGVRLFDEDRTVAHFTFDIYRGVYREPVVLDSNGNIDNLNDNEVVQNEF